MTIIFGIAAVLLIIAFGVGAVWLTYTNQQLKDSIANDPDTRKVLSDRIGALEERQLQALNEIEANARAVQSMRGAFGALKKEWYRVLPQAAEPNGESPVDLDDLFSVHSQQPTLPRKPRR